MLKYEYFSPGKENLISWDLIVRKNLLPLQLGAAAYPIYY